jgi:glycosyltransferase involved in cell wall biosynthesis
MDPLDDRPRDLNEGADTPDSTMLPMGTEPLPAPGEPRGAAAGETRRPLVVMVRPTDVETDSRAKKMGISLDRLGYEVVVLGRSGTGRRQDGTIGGARVTLLVPQSRLRGKPRRMVRLPLGSLRRIERTLNARLQKVMRIGDARLLGVDHEGWYRWAVAQRDFRTTYGAELVRLNPDVIHCHDPRMLPVAFAVAARIHKHTGGQCQVVYDARENFAGIPEENISLRRYHMRLLKRERQLAPRAAAMLTVSEDTATALADRLALRRRPTVVLNAPVAGAQPTGKLRSLREDCGLAPEVPLMVYQGAATAIRGTDTMIEALVHDSGLHAALVVVPFPHPREQEMTELAASLGVADRLHIVPPVPADQVPGYLAEADVAVSPILKGPANHEAGLPNKLFEMLHAGLPIVTSDLQAMSAFVREHEIGVVFRSGDATDLARAVKEVLADPMAYAEPKSRAALINRWSWQNQESPLAEAYGHVLAPGAGHTQDSFPEVHVHFDAPVHDDAHPQVDPLSETEPPNDFDSDHALHDTDETTRQTGSDHRARVTEPGG